MLLEELAFGKSSGGQNIMKGVWPWRWCLSSLPPRLENATTYTPLERLPIELIDQLASWLPLHSAMSLALCSHRLYDALGREILRRMNVNKTEEAKFLQALDRDLPETLFCFFCGRLHVLFPGCRTKRSIRTEERFQRVADGRCQNADGKYNFGVAHTYFAGFSFEHVQMAVKLGRRREHFSEAKAYIERLSFIGRPASGRLTILPAYNGLYLFETRLLRDQVYVRAQTWFWIPGDEKGKLEMPRRFYTTVCAHLDSNSSVANAYTTAFRCNLHHLFDEARLGCCEKCCELIRCQFCPTEVAIEVRRSPRDLSGSGFLVATKWQILGSGTSPMEPEWKSHLEAATKDPWPFAPGYLPGRIRDEFEASVEAKHDSLMSVAKARKLLD